MNFQLVIVLCFSLSDRIRTVLSQEIGEQCTTASHEKGTCMSQRDCVEREKASHHNEFEQCKLHSDGTPIICCVTNQSNLSKREQTSSAHSSVGGNDVTSSSGDPVETRFYIPKKKLYTKQSHKSTSIGKNTYSEGGFNTHSYKQVGRSFDDYDFYSPSPAGFDSSNYYDVPPSRRPESTHGSSKGDRSGQPTSSYGNRNDRVDVVADGLASNHGQPAHGGGQRGFSGTHSPNKNSETRKSNKASSSGGGSSYEGYNFNAGSSSNKDRNSNKGYDSNSYNRGGEESNDGVYYPSDGNSQRPSGGNVDLGGGDESVYYPDNGVYESRPAVDGHRPGGGSSSQYWPSSGGAGNSNRGTSESSRPNRNHPTTTHRPSTSTGLPIWGTTQRSTTRKPSTSGHKPTSSSYQQQKRISEQKCSEYSRIVTSTISAIPLAINGQATTHKVTDCRVQPTSLVVGGSKAKLGEFPHMAALGFRSGSSITFNCGGTLISEEYVLTAAHCTHSSLGNPVVVRLGDLNLELDNDGAKPQTVNVASVTVHPNYKSPQIYHDIALIRLARRISFDKNMRPACLHAKREVNAEKVLATGWGSTNYGEISSDDLLKVGLDIIDSNQCNTLYGPDQKFPKGITNSIMCAGELSGKKDTCQGDSGGPLQIHDINNKCIYYVIGITSSGKSCGIANSPGLYTRVSEYVPWIESIVWRS